MEKELSKGARQALDLLAENPAQVLYIVQDYDRLSQRVEELERRVRDTAAVDARRSSIDLSAKAGSFGFKHYYDPTLPAELNDRYLAETCRLYHHTHGIWPDGCTDHIIRLAGKIDAEIIANGGA